MTLRFCPQCGGALLPRPRGSNAQACSSCGKVFSITTQAHGHGNAGAAQQDAGDAAVFRPRLRRIVAVAAVGLLLAGLLVAVLPGPGSRGKPDAPVARIHERAEASALYEAAGKFSRIDVYSQRNEAQGDGYLVQVTDMHSGALLAEPQTWRINRQDNRAYLRTFSDGQLYLQLEKKMVLRFDPGANAFVDLTPQLIARHPDQLGGGIAQVEFGFRDRPDSFKITTADGTVYHAYWLAGQLLPEAGISDSDEQRAAQATGLSEHWLYAELEGSHGIENRRYQLIRYWQRADPGQPQYLGYFRLYTQHNKDVERSPTWYRQVAPTLWVARHVHEKGVQRVELIAPATPRFNAQVLADNASHLLLVYSPTPTSSEGRVVQLLDKQSQQVVWSREVAQVPMMTSDRGGTYLTAQGLPSGFFVQSSPLEPGFLMDNQGNVLHSFQ